MEEGNSAFIFLGKQLLSHLLFQNSFLILQGFKWEHFFVLCSIFSYLQAIPPPPFLKKKNTQVRRKAILKFLASSLHPAMQVCSPQCVVLSTLYLGCDLRVFPQVPQARTWAPSVTLRGTEAHRGLWGEVIRSLAGTVQSSGECCNS